MYRIEFIGVPGSGKSTIRKGLIKSFKEVNKKQFLSVEEAFLQVSRNEIDRVYRIILNVLPKRVALKIFDKLLNRNLLQYNAQNRFLAEWGKSLEFFFRSSEFDKMSINDREIVISSFIETGSLYESINGSLPTDTVVFFEEGFIQKSFMFVSPLDFEYTVKSNLFNYLENIPLPDLIIYVNTDLTLCNERMIGRPEGLTKRLKNIDKTGIIKFLEISDLHLQNTVCWLKKNKNINLIIVNNNEPLDNIIIHLEQKIKTCF